MSDISLRTQSLPPQGSTNYYNHYTSVDKTVRAMGIQPLDTFPGATDDDKLDAALVYQAATTGRPPIGLGARTYSFSKPRTLYSGLRIIGVEAGPKNLELTPSGQPRGGYVPSRIVLGGTISSGTSSWWNGTGSNLYDIYMADFACQGSLGSSIYQFMDVPSGSLYACQFHSLSFDFMRGVMGRKDRLCAITQVVLSGHWTVNNIWDTPFHLGGSDNSLWMGGYVNMGPSTSPVQTGTYADGDYEVIFNNLSKTNVGMMYLSMMNGWRGLKITGNANTGGIHLFGGVFEGYKPTTDLNAGAAPGSVIRIEGGAGDFFGPMIGQGMNNPDAAEGGLVHMTGGQWNFWGPTCFRGAMAESVPFFFHSGGRLRVEGAQRGSGETWTGLPRFSTNVAGAPAPNATQNSFCCTDMSVVAA